MNHSANVQRVIHQDREIILIGTAHVSQESVQEVEEVIRQENPDTVCVELCQARMEALSQKDRWRNMNLFKVIREGKTFLLLANLIMAAFQKRLGDQLGVQPGQEMIQAVHTARELEAEIVLADRDIQITLKRTWHSLPFREKFSVMGQLLFSIFAMEEIKEEDIEKLKERDALHEALETFAAKSPTMKRILIDERDQYLAEKIRTAPGNKLVAVVGAGHVPGILEELNKEHNLNHLTEVPPASKWTNLLKWGLPIAILTLITYGFATSTSDISWEIVKSWVLINGSLSALGSALAFAHPLTIAAAFVAAPITSLNPMMAAGWVAGLVEAVMHKPQVKDFENLSADTTHLKGFWKNKITRVLLVVVFANLGSSIGTFIATYEVVKLL